MVAATGLDKSWSRTWPRSGPRVARMQTMKNLSCWADSYVGDFLAGNNGLNSALIDEILSKNSGMVRPCYLKFSKLDTTE